MKIIISSHFDEFFMPPEATADLHLVKKEIQKALQDKKTILNEWLKFQNRSKGKFIRAQLALASGELLNLPKNTVIKWSAACELIHTASLILHEPSMLIMVICRQALTLRSQRPDNSHRHASGNGYW